MAIHLRSAEELEKMHRAGLIVHEVLAALRAAVKPGVTTMDLEKLAEQKLAGSQASRRSRATRVIRVRYALR
jgi:methionyl aminopeptidase